MFILNLLPQVTTDDQQILAKGVIETAGGLTEDVKNLLMGVAAVVAIGVIIGVAIKTSFKVSAIVVTGLAAALFLWLVNGGIETSRDKVKEDIDNALPAVVQIDSSFSPTLSL